MRSAELCGKLWCDVVWFGILWNALGYSGIIYLTAKILPLISVKGSENRLPVQFRPL